MNPFVEEFRRGDVPRDVRLLAAQGHFPLKSRDDLVELWRILTADPDEEVRAAANKSLMSFPAMLQDRLEREVDEIARKDAQHDNLVKALIANNLTGSEVSGFRNGVRAALVASEQWSPEEIDALFNEATGATGAARQGVDPGYQLNTAEKVITALRGNRQERATLIRDPDPLVSIGVLNHPLVTKVELKSFIADHSLPESVRHQAQLLLNEE